MTDERELTDAEVLAELLSPEADLLHRDNIGSGATWMLLRRLAAARREIREMREALERADYLMQEAVNLAYDTAYRWAAAQARIEATRLRERRGMATSGSHDTCRHFIANALDRMANTIETGPTPPQTGGP